MSNTNKRYNEEFKKQIVELIRSEKNINEVVKEYNIARSTVNKWVKDYSSFGSSKAKDNRSDEENELIKLKKENQKLKMENDILKQAALIMGRN